MKKHISSAVILLGICCAVLCLCSCGKRTPSKRYVDSETLRLMQKTQAELTACVERCRSAAEESNDREILLALANSQQVLVDRHEAIISILLRKYKMERISTTAFSIEMDPRMLVLNPLDEYKDFLLRANPERTLQEVLIALEITNKVLKSDQDIEHMIDPYAEEELDIDFYLCPVCGYLSMQEPEESCPVCHSDRNKQIKLKDGEIPPRENGTYVTVSE